MAWAAQGTILVLLVCSDTEDSPTGWTAWCVTHSGVSSNLSAAGTARRHPAGRKSAGGTSSAAGSSSGVVRRTPGTSSRSQAGVAPARFCPIHGSLSSWANPPSLLVVTSGGRLPSLVSPLPAGTRVHGAGRGRRFSASSPPLLSSLPPFPNLGGGRSPVADSLTHP